MDRLEFIIMPTYTASTLSIDNPTELRPSSPLSPSSENSENENYDDSDKENMSWNENRRIRSTLWWEKRGIQDNERTPLADITYLFTKESKVDKDSDEIIWNKEESIQKVSMTRRIR